jgi:hypothetical protein
MQSKRSAVQWQRESEIKKRMGADFSALKLAEDFSSITFFFFHAGKKYSHSIGIADGALDDLPLGIRQGNLFTVAPFIRRLIDSY